MNGLIGVDATTWANHRGYGRFTRGLLPRLAERVDPERLVLFLDDVSAREGGFPPGVRQIVVPLAEAPTRAASAQGHRSVADLLRMSRAVAATPLDLFFFPSAYTYFPLLRPVRSVVTIHDVIAESHPLLVFPKRHREWFWRAKLLLARLQADLILTVSETSRQAIIRQFRLRPQCVTAVPEGPDPVFSPRPPSPSRTAVLARYGLADGERFLLYVGGFSPHKNLAALLRAHAELIREPGRANVRLVMVGDYTGDSFYSCFADLVQLRSDLQLTDAVSFPGFVPDADLAELYPAAQALVLPSLDEGFGLPVLEAMASGTPVVSSNRGAMPEVLDGAGRLFDPTCVADLTAALAAVLDDERARSEMARRGLDRARAYTWDRSAEAVVRIFDELLMGAR